MKLYFVFMLTIKLSLSIKTNTNDVLKFSTTNYAKMINSKKLYITQSKLQSISEESSINVSPKCKELRKNLAQVSSTFVSCFIIHSRPITACTVCIKEYIHYKNIYEQLFNNSINVTKECQEQLLNQDRIHIIVTTCKFVENLWKRGNCDNCFKTIDKETLSNEILNFLHISHSLEQCFGNYTYFQKNKIENSTVCSSCKNLYHSLSEAYKSLVEETNNNVCADIIDKMNITRHMWRNHYHCIPHQKPEISVYIMAFITCLIVIVFYPAYKFAGIKNTSLIIKQKRLSEMRATCSTSGQFLSMSH